MNRVSAGEISRDLEAYVRKNFEVEADDAFFSTDLNLWEEGYIDSLGVIELIGYIESTYAIEVPRAMLFDPGFTSIDGIAERIAELANAIRGCAGSSSTEDTASLEGVVELRHGEDDEAAIFCIAGVHIYHPFAHSLSPQYPVFGVYLGKEHQWIERIARGESAEIPSTEEMAAEYILSIRQQQPKGPYRLAGVSYGGVLAYEMAQQLSRNGEHIEALILFDARLYWRIARSGGPLVRARYRARRFLMRTMGRYSSRNKSSQVAKARVVLSLEALENYEQRMQTYSGSALLCRALDEPGNTSGNIDLKLGWSGLIQGGISVIDVPGDHLGILSPENVDNMRDAIESYLAGCI